MRTGLTLISAGNIQDPAQNPLNGTAVILATDTNDQPITSTAGITTPATGNTTVSSPTVTGLSTTAGFAPGQPISGAGIPAGATLAAVPTAASITGTFTSSSPVVTLVSGSLAGVIVGQSVSGTSIPSGTTLVSLSPLTLSANPTGAGTAIALTINADAVTLSTNAVATASAVALTVSTGAVVAGEVCVPITNGVLGTLYLPDTSLTRPANICYRITIQDAEGTPIYTLTKVQPSNAVLNLDTYTPNVSAQAVIARGPAGASLVARGAWVNTATYSQLDIVSYTDGSSYVSVVNSNTGNTPSSSPGSWAVLAEAGILTGAYDGSLSLTSVTLPPGNVLAEMLTNTANATFAIADDQGVAAIAVLADATAVVPKLQTGDSVILNKFGYNALNAVFGINDASNNYALLILTDATTMIAKLVAEQATVTELNLGGAVITELPDDNTHSLAGLVVSDVGGNVAFGITSDGKIIGQLATYPTPLPVGTATDIRSGGTLKPLFGLNLELIVGESTGDGIQGLPLASTTQSLTNLMFSSGVRQGSMTSASLYVPPLTGLTSFVPLVQQQDYATNATVLAEYPTAGTSFVFGETPLNGICDRLASDLLTRGVKARFLGACSALPGATYVSIASSSDGAARTFGNTTVGAMFSQISQLAAAAVSTAAGSYGTVGALTVTVIFGINDDENTGNTEFGDEMVRYQAAVQATIQGATGQSSAIPMVIMQPARWSTVSPSRAVNGLVTPVVAPQQLAICVANPENFLFSTPTYFLQASADGVHFTGPAYQWLGEYLAETKLNYLLGLPSSALIPGTPLLEGKTIHVPFSVVNGPLYFDTEQVADTAGDIPGSKYGFEVWDASGNVVPILSATIGPDNESVRLTVGSTPTGGSVGYGWSGVAGAPGGPLTGPRGNLRDCNPARSYYGHPNMYHWAPHFKYTLS